MMCLCVGLCAGCECISGPKGVQEGSTLFVQDESSALDEQPNAQTDFANVLPSECVSEESVKVKKPTLWHKFVR